jgi:hypothetical protein
LIAIIIIFFQLFWVAGELPAITALTSNRLPQLKLLDSAPSRSANAAQTFVRSVFNLQLKLFE